MSDSTQRAPGSGAGAGAAAAGTAGAGGAASAPAAPGAPAETREPPGFEPIPTPEEKSSATATGERIDRGIADFVKRAVSAGVGAAARSKEDIVRVAATEVRSWLEHMNFSEEIAKALSHMVIEVKTEIRFRPAEDGRLVPQTTSDLKMKSSDS